MANSQTFAYLIIFTFVFIGLSTAYGVTQPKFNSAIYAPTQCLFNNNPTGSCSFPVWNPPQPSNVTAVAKSTPWYQCIFSTACVIATVTGTSVGTTGQAIWNGMSEIAYGISLFPIYAFVFFNKIFQVLVLMNAIFSVMNNDYGVPFLSYIFFAFTTLTIVYGIAVLKPGGHGG